MEHTSHGNDTPAARAVTRSLGTHDHLEQTGLWRCDAYDDRRGDSRGPRRASNGESHIQPDLAYATLDQARGTVNAHMTACLSDSKRATIVAALRELSSTQKRAMIPDLISSFATEIHEEICLHAAANLSIPALASLIEKLDERLHVDFMNKLPQELIEQIFMNLSPKDLLTCSVASKRWREQALADKIWRLSFRREGWLLDTVLMKKIEETEILCRADKASHKQVLFREQSLADVEASRKRQRGMTDYDYTADRVTTITGCSRRQGAAGGAMNHAMENDDSTVPDGFAKHRGESLHLSRTEEDIDMTDLLRSSPAFRDCQEATLNRLHPISSNLVDFSLHPPRTDWFYLYNQRRRLENNWNHGRCSAYMLPHPDHLKDAHDECVYAIQIRRNLLISGSRDKTIKIWNLNTRRCNKTLIGGHDKSVLCLQFSVEDDIIVSGGSDSRVVIWRLSTGDIIQKIIAAHRDAVLSLRFDDRYLVTSSKDKTIKIWNRATILADALVVPHSAARELPAVSGMNPQTEYDLLMTLTGHSSAVNAVDIVDGCLVSASGDRTIMIRDIATGEYIKKFSGHTKGVACVRSDGTRVVSGSSDKTIRVFDIATSAEVACLSGHTGLVRTVQARFGNLSETKQDLEAAARTMERRYLDSIRDGSEPAQLSLKVSHDARSEDFQHVRAIGAKIPPGGGGSKWSRIVSGSYDESILVWKKDREGRWAVNKKLDPSTILEERIRQNQASQRDGTGVVDQTRSSMGFQSETEQSHMTAAAGRRLNRTPAQLAQPVAGGTSDLGMLPPAALPGVSTHRDGRNRIFKLQFDCRRLVSCSQSPYIVYWDFADGDVELEEASQFFLETH